MPGDRRLGANFSATGVRHYLTAGAKLSHPSSGGPAAIEALPVTLLGRASGLRPLSPAASGPAVNLPVIALGAEVHDAPTLIANTLNLPKIVHPYRPRPPGTGSPRACRATTHSSNASTRGDLGLGVSPPGPFSWLVDRDPSSRRDRPGANYPEWAACTESGGSERSATAMPSRRSFSIDRPWSGKGQSTASKGTWIPKYVPQFGR